MKFDSADLDVDVYELYARLPPPSVKPPTTDTPAASLSGTKPICIRVPARVIHAFKVEAAKTGGSYQANMNRVLSVAAAGFV
jgi:predicted DNA binding CopG/RHH family protein